ncbi:RNA-binding protein 25 [Austrofundulus limnaeus]|uniref:RNA-binding protein 25 n=1 Tax=Austrofundulus limnaeus TaxID=52670 RepID=A0A2I4CYI4_AUSLI|nr:PREDICTED: RNA-binding protein 25-like [Austrofundulus limnaeus]
MMNRPQLGIPLPPGIPPPPYAGFAPPVPPGTPMIPVHMGVVTAAPTVLVPTTVALVQNPVSIKKDPSLRTKDLEDSGGPTTTVFVGNISEKASDMLVRQLLAKCGIVLSWKRVQGASGKLQAFGFCEYKEPESTLRALRLLHELLLGDKKLLVKVDAKTKAQLEDWKAKKRSTNGGITDGSRTEGGPEEEVLDEETLRRDQVVKGAIDVLIREYSSELNAPSQDSDGQTRNKKRKEKKEEDINAMELEDDKRDLISREISKFRDTHKKLEEEKGKKEKERLELERERRERDKERERERERRDREKEKEREREKEKERDRERERERDRERERTKERERSRDISEARSKSRERTREDKKRDRDEDEEDVYERRRLERRLRDKEAAYQERLKNWEIREKKKARDYSKDTEREEERRREMMKEAKRLKEFLEDYDDDRDDPKYYRGSALQKRLRDREKEVEMDERDRKREKEELEEIRQRLLAEGHPDPDAELQRIEEEAERKRQLLLSLEPEEEVNKEKTVRDKDRDRNRDRERDRERDRDSDRDRERNKRVSERPVEPKPRGPQQHSDDDDDDVNEGEEDDYHNGEDSQEAKPQLKPIMRPITTAPSVSSASGNVTPNTPGVDSPCGIIIPGENTPDLQPLEEHRPKIGLSLKLGATNSPSQLSVGKRKKLAAVDSVFNKFDDEEADEQPRKRKLVPLDYGDDEKNLGLDGADISAPKSSINTEEKHKHIKSLIEKIPTSRPELFSYPLDWAMVDSTLMDRRIKPWINKKIIEYIGEEEPSLVDFVCSKIMAHSSPQGILDDVAMLCPTVDNSDMWTLQAALLKTAVVVHRRLCSRSVM